MICSLGDKDAAAICQVINSAACAYKGAIPADCYHEPYMPMAELLREMRDISFTGWHEGERLTGVMGLRVVKGVSLIRHAYVLPDRQREGVGSKLLRRLMKDTTTEELLVGTWADATWATAFYEKHGFGFRANKDELLARYWRVPPRQVEVSVVLGILFPNRSGEVMVD